MARQLSLGNHLTSPDPELDRQLSKTYAGMAHIAGTGPKGATCRECLYWGNRNGKQRYSGKAMGGNMLKPGPCNRYREIMGKKGGEVPYGASACRHFERNERPPKIHETPKW